MPEYKFNEGQIIQDIKDYIEKDGHNKNDLMKVIHYAIIQLSQDHYVEQPSSSLLGEKLRNS